MFVSPSLPETANAERPIAMLSAPSVEALNDSLPIAILSVPVSKASAEVNPIADVVRSTCHSRQC